MWIKIFIVILLMAPVVWGQTTFRLSNNTDVEDVYIAKNAPNTNYATSAPIYLSTADASQKKMIFKFSNVRDSIGEGAIISFAACTLRCVSSNGDTGYVSIYPLWKTEGPEAEITWNRWNDDLAYEWTTEGVICAHDDGSFNTEDNKACTAARADKMATAEDVVVDVTVGWHGWEITTSAQRFYDASEEWSYVFEEGAEAGQSSWSPMEGAFDPILVVTYTTDGEPAAGNRRQILLRSE